MGALFGKYPWINTEFMKLYPQEQSNYMTQYPKQRTMKSGNSLK